MVTAFQQRVYDLLRQVPKGKVTTYKDVGDKLGVRSYQAIGQACKHNPFAPKVPCHRVVSASGALGGFNGTTSGREIKRKIELLRHEGVRVEHGKVRAFSEQRHVW